MYSTFPNLLFLVFQACIVIPLLGIVLVLIFRVKKKTGNEKAKKTSHKLQILVVVCLSITLLFILNCVFQKIHNQMNYIDTGTIVTSYYDEKEQSCIKYMSKIYVDLTSAISLKEEYIVNSDKIVLSKPVANVIEANLSGFDKLSEFLYGPTINELLYEVENFDNCEYVSTGKSQISCSKEKLKEKLKLYRDPDNYKIYFYDSDTNKYHETNIFENQVQHIWNQEKKIKKTRNDLYNKQIDISNFIKNEDVILIEKTTSITPINIYAISNDRLIMRFISGTYEYEGNYYLVIDFQEAKITDTSGTYKAIGYQINI